MLILGPFHELNLGLFNVIYLCLHQVGRLGVCDAHVEHQVHAHGDVHNVCGHEPRKRAPAHVKSHVVVKQIGARATNARDDSSHSWQQYLLHGLHGTNMEPTQGRTCDGLWTAVGTSHGQWA